MGAPLRYALIGVGANVASMHRKALALDGVTPVAACDLNEEAARSFADEHDCPWFADWRAMLAAIDCDAVVIMAPHRFHAEMAIGAFAAGRHVLCEKPMGLHAGEADAMISAAEASRRLLAINFQQRTRAEVVAAKGLIDEGQLGEIQHVDVKVTWTRTARYYREAGWRGSWNGEAGALLMNQAPHELDMLCWLAGMPTRVHAWTPTIAHDIAPEDTAQAMLQWENGVLGSFHASTAEAGQPQRFEIIGTRGWLQLGQGRLRFRRFGQELREFLRESPKSFAEPKMEEIPVPLGPPGGEHIDIHRNFCAAIRDDAPLVAGGRSARAGLELANGMILSHHSDATIEFPLERERYVRLLRCLQRKEDASTLGLPASGKAGVGDGGRRS